MMNCLFKLCLLALLTLPAHGTELTADGFSLPEQSKQFNFPRDHGSHPSFRTEWWYVTGHMDAAEGQRFGFQLTFFRQAQRVGQQTAQLHLAHAALLEAQSGRFLHEEKLQRAGWAAFAEETHLHVQQDQWQLKMNAQQNIQLAYTVRGEAALELQLQPSKPLVIFGKDGVSRKGEAKEAASHYLTFPRLVGSGQLKLGNQNHTVKAQAWMDHEFSSSQLDVGQVGWDWAAIQLNDGQEIMAYRMRRADGSTDPYSTLASIDTNGSVTHHSAVQFDWQPTAHWTSPRTFARYPNEVKVTWAGRSLQLRPVAKDQEQGGSITGLPYWEGACDVVDEKRQVIGRAFLELAGYAGDLSRHLGNKK
jgi:predicted secreted hydrolase